MNHRFFARTAIAIAATAITSLGVTAASAQTTTGSNPHARPATAKYVKSTVKPRLLCDTIAPALCIFTGHLNPVPPLNS